MQSLPQHFLRRPEGNEALMGYQAGSIHGMMGGGNFAAPTGSVQLPQHHRKFIDLAQQHGSSNIREDGQNRSQGFEQQVLNPVHQAYLQQYAFQAAQQKSPIGMHSQQQMKMSMFSPPGKDQDVRMGAMKMPAANQAQTSSKKPTEQVVRGETHADHSQQNIKDQRVGPEPSSQPTLLGQTMPLKPMQAPQSQQHFQNITNNPIAMAAHMQALALERNIDLSVPANATLMAQLIPMIQSRMVAQQKVNESSMATQSSSIHVPKQQVSSPQVANENSPRGNTSSDASAQSGSVKVRQTVPATVPSTNSSAAMTNNTSNVSMQHFSLHGRENQLPPRQQMMVGNGMPPMPPLQPSPNIKQGADSGLTKGAQSGSESMQMPYARPMNRSSPQPNSSNDGLQGNPSTSQGVGAAQKQQQPLGFTKQQLHVLKAQILAFRRIKVYMFPLNSPYCTFGSLITFFDDIMFYFLFFIVLKYLILVIERRCNIAS